MSLIKELGGYDRASKIANCESGVVHPTKALLDALLEYRREHRIFEAGDKVVYPHLSHERLFSVKYVGGDQIVVYELWDEMGAKTFTEFHPYSDIRHATDAEIKAGSQTMKDTILATLFGFGFFTVLFIIYLLADHLKLN